MRKAALVVQRHYRAYAARRRFVAMRLGFNRLQAAIRSRVLSHRFRHLRGHIVALQARCRGCLVRREFHRKMWAIVKIQSHVRRLIAQRYYKKLKVSCDFVIHISLFFFSSELMS
jgi:myosin-7